MKPTTRRRSFILATVLIAPLAVLALLELLLLVIEYRSPFVDEDPFLGFSKNSPLFERTVSDGRSVFTTRERKLRWFNPQQFLAVKPDNGYRIVSLGGSTTFGRPYADQTSFSGWLRVLLPEADSVHTYEVINAGGVSYASYRVVNLMKEIDAYDPDLYLVYTGNNEFLEDRTYRDLKEEPAVLRGLRESLQGLRTYGLIRQAVAPFRGSTGDTVGGKFRMGGDVSAILDQSAGIDRYQRDPVQNERILNHFRLNLNRMVDIAGASGAAIIFIVPASNEKDFSPFKSSFNQTLSPEESMEWHSLYGHGKKLLDGGKLEAARQVFETLKDRSPEFADVRYRLGLSLFGLGEYRAAKEEFIAARDNDVAPLRATTRIQELVREVAAGRGVPVFDFQQYLERELLEKAGHECLGNESFYDHCHPTIETHQLIAEQVRILAREIPDVPGLFGQRSGNESAVYDNVLGSLGPEYYGVRDLNIAKVLRWAGKRREAELFVRKAVRELKDHPEAWYLLGLTYQERGVLDSATEALTRSLSLDPSNAQALNTLGSIALRKGETGRAIHLYGEAISRNPGLHGAHYNLGNALVRQGDVEGAMRAYRQELAIDPRNTMALNNLGFLHLNRQEFDIARPLFEETIALDPLNIEAYSNLGIVAVAKGDIVTAREMFRQALSISPEDQFARDWIQKLEESE